MQDEIVSCANSLQQRGADTPKTTAEEIYNSLGIDGDTSILLLIAWCTDKQRCLLTLFPKAASSDVIFKTNNEKRPALHICTKTSMNETFGGIYSFLPSQAIWAFDYMWSVCMPHFADKRFLQQNRQMNTDGNDKLYGPFALWIPGTYVQSQHQLCTFHLLTQGWQPNKITTSRIVTKSEIGATILEAIRNWFLSWTDDVESATELQNVT